MAKGKVTKKSKTATVIVPKIEKGTDAWLERHGIKPDKKVVVYKKVSKDFKTQEGRKNETLYEIGKTVELKDWRPTENECGKGKLHACPEPFFADEFRNEPGDIYIAIEVDKKDLYPWDDDPDFPHKIAFRKGKVLYQVDRMGRKV